MREGEERKVTLTRRRRRQTEAAAVGHGVTQAPFIFLPLSSCRRNTHKVGREGKKAFAVMKENVKVSDMGKKGGKEGGGKTLLLKSFCSSTKILYLQAK